MTGKGKAFDRPVVNKIHKQAVIAAARAAASSDTPRAGVETELYALLADSGLDVQRGGEAKAAIREAVDKLAANDNPLQGLNPPPSCGPHGENPSHKNHHFFCLARRQPCEVERKLRITMFKVLREAFAAQQHGIQTVSMRTANHCLVCPALAHELRQVRLRSS